MRGLLAGLLEIFLYKMNGEKLNTVFRSWMTPPLIFTEAFSKFKHINPCENYNRPLNLSLFMGFVSRNSTEVGETIS